MHLYIHVPFCARRCSYCDFAIAVRREVPSGRYADAVLLEWRGWQSHAAWRDSPGIETIYFGGGTPSRITPDAVAHILDKIGRTRAIAGDAEITLEANPDDVTPSAAAAWQAAGVNRISLGAQSFDPRVLAWMHRTHSADQIPRAVDMLRSAGFTNLSLDLIFSLPAALERDWPDDLDRALALGPDHLSLYGLTVEPHTPLSHWIDRAAVIPLDDESYARDFLHAGARLRQAGFEHYEVSNAARPGRRARHNSAYWTRAPFIGLGPSAHSAFGHERQWNVREWTAYERAIASGGSVVGGHERIEGAARRLEELYLGLRTTDGVACSLVGPVVAERWRADGWATIEAGRVRLSPEGWLRLDALVAAA